MIVFIVWAVFLSPSLGVIWMAVGKDALHNFKTEPFFTSFYMGGTVAVVGAFTASLTCAVFR